MPDPTKMTCEEFVALDEDVQPEVVYWLDGYNEGAERGALETAGAKNAAGTPVAVVLDRDVMLMVEECREAPAESLWERIKSTL